MSKQEVYHSSTLGPIPLTFTGRRLMQNLREAVQELLQKRVEQTKRGQVGSQNDWEDVSKARGKIAQYMSELEKRPPQRLEWQSPLDARCKPAAMVLDYVPPKSAAELELDRLRKENEVLRKGNDAFKEQNQRLRESNSRYLCETASLKKELEQAKAATKVTNMQLPEIPKGYTLQVVGPLVSIAPVEKLKPIRGKRK